MLLTAAEQHAGERDFTALPALRLGPLDRSASRALLDRLTGGRADPGVREELLREAAGNPGCSPPSPPASPRTNWPDGAGCRSP